MTAARNLRRLFDIRKAEEHQREIEVKVSLTHLRSLQDALMSASDGAKQARSLIAQSVDTGEQADRIAGLQEMGLADRKRKVLAEKIELVEAEVASIRQAFLGKRIERRQVEALLDAARERVNVEAIRKSQTVLDDLHLLRKTKKNRSANSSIAEV